MYFFFLCSAVAFSVTPQVRIPHHMIGLFNEDAILKYDNIITNVGNAYNPDTGKRHFLSCDLGQLPMNKKKKHYLCISDRHVHSTCERGLLFHLCHFQ